MTRKKLKIIIRISIIYYGLIILLGWYLCFIKPGNNKEYYNFFKELVVPLVAIPAPYLGYCFQRRSTFNEALRQLWGNIIESVNQARQYTFEKKPSHDLYGLRCDGLAGQWSVLVFKDK